ncbi:MAG: N-acetylmuramoyl-L-alanine amidase, partial [Nostoc sp.]
LIAQSQVRDDRITTHRLVDRSGKKIDPINFDGNKFLNLLNTYRQVRPIYKVSN